jgi:glycosyltransferase involved in cell wall biosynthesis
LIARLGIGDRITLIPQGDDAMMANLYTNAIAFVHPSNYEGFGIPLLEAFTYGCPVISSNRGSLPEIGGEAALYFDPANIDEMAATLLRVIDDPSLRQKLIAAGAERVKHFSWDRSARETVDLYKRVCA